MFANKTRSTSLLTSSTPIKINKKRTVTNVAFSMDSDEISTNEEIASFSQSHPTKESVLRRGSRALRVLSASGRKSIEAEKQHRPVKQLMTQLSEWLVLLTHIIVIILNLTRGSYCTRSVDLLNSILMLDYNAISVCVYVLSICTHLIILCGSK